MGLILVLVTIGTFFYVTYFRAQIGLADAAAQGETVSSELSERATSLATQVRTHAGIHGGGMARDGTRRHGTAQHGTARHSTA